MIQLVDHSEIDFERYNLCVAHSTFPTIYAQSWYLDIVTENDWKALVLNDYQAVMPIPFGRMKRSFWKKSLVQPPYCQQLGVFAQKELTQAEFNLFYLEFNALNPLAYLFNHANNSYLEQEPNLCLRTNYILKLDKDYADLFANFSTSKRQRVRKAQKQNLELKNNIPLEEFLDFYYNNLPIRQSNKTKSIHKKLINELIKKQLVTLLGAYEKNDLVAVALFVFYQDRIYYLNAASNDKGRSLLAIDLIINSIIEPNANSGKILDFEGSQIPGVAKFMQSFGAENQPFYTTI